MTLKPHIILVEDDHEIATLVSNFLSINGFQISVARNSTIMDQLLSRTRPDLMILDIMLPGEDGLSITRRLRGNYRFPIIMLTAMDELIDRIVGLEIGADDYLAKPFNSRELLARIRAVLRRSSRLTPEPEIPARIYEFAGWKLQPATQVLTDPGNVRVILTSAEFDLLKVFCEHGRRVLNRDQLLDLTRGRMSTPYDRSIDTLVSRIRSKIERNPKEPEYVKTVRLGGYMFTPEVSVR